MKIKNVNWTYVGMLLIVIAIFAIAIAKITGILPPDDLTNFHFYHIPR